MKGLIKEVAILTSIIILLYLFFSKNPFFENLQNTISGFFSYFLSRKEEKVIYFEISLEDDSQYEVKGNFDLRLNGTPLEASVDKIILNELSKSSSKINFKCIENCNLIKFQKYIEFSGKTNNFYLDNFRFSSIEPIIAKFKVENLDNLEIEFKSQKIEICLSNATLFLAYGAYKLEQKILSDCLKLDRIIKISFNYKDGRSTILGYTNTFKSVFISI